MGALDIPLDTGTALIAAVALGISVDDTIHFLSEYQHQRAQGLATILCVGFGVDVFSRFIPVVNFGLLCAIIMITAVIGDLVLLPAVMLSGGRKVPLDRKQSQSASR